MIPNVDNKNKTSRNPTLNNDDISMEKSMRLFKDFQIDTNDSIVQIRNSNYGGHSLI